jgi:hypothetical protein
MRLAICDGPATPQPKTVTVMVAVQPSCVVPVMVVTPTPLPVTTAPLEVIEAVATWGLADVTVMRLSLGATPPPRAPHA